ncbi:DNA-binding phage protein [Dokdonella fugitiva]|uniref:DNA-binding phage protein n=1 Tax=Dokdonella fugitiva TaxID=328517 RepID=A0A839EWH6_9GAMM|nr:CII family transcriptional regulator [Dokdonella fugitiva]MBA8886132.1 DNA-binding phage protein [Dokdonella fugitiva]
MSEPGAQAIQTAILRALAERGQSAVAAETGISDTRVSRWKSCAPDGGGLDILETARVLSALGLTVVPLDPDGMVVVPVSTHSALHVLLRDYADTMLSGKGRPECK